jgi:hypothetical protein
MKRKYTSGYESVANKTVPLPCQLFKLPIVLFSIILPFCRPYELLSFTSTCKRYRELLFREGFLSESQKWITYFKFGFHEEVEYVCFDDDEREDSEDSFIIKEPPIMNFQNISDKWEKSRRQYSEIRNGLRMCERDRYYLCGIVSRAQSRNEYSRIQSLIHTLNIPLNLCEVIIGRHNELCLRVGTLTGDAGNEPKYLIMNSFPCSSQIVEVFIMFGGCSLFIASDRAKEFPRVLHHTLGQTLEKMCVEFGIGVSYRCLMLEFILSVFACGKVERMPKDLLSPEDLNAHIQALFLPDHFMERFNVWSN